jgi:hypothetical protein
MKGSPPILQKARPSCTCSPQRLVIQTRNPQSDALLHLHLQPATPRRFMNAKSNQALSPEP